MGKRKGRSVRRNKQIKETEPEELVKAPHSFVIHRGIPGDHIIELTKDFRKVMEPFTAVSLKERKNNTIRDFLQIAGIFHVSNICIFSRTENGVYFKVGHIPRGPTLTFKLDSFILARDVLSSLKKQMIYDEAFKHAPLIVLNNFSGPGMQMKLMTTIFQNLFPQINLTSVKLSNIRRCVLLNYNSDTKSIEFRHYVIKVAPTGISKAVKKVVQGKVPNLSKFSDISEFITKSGMLSESEAEDDPNDNVTLAQKLSSRGNLAGGLSAIRLSEVGPRLTMKLLKVEEGLFDGDVLYHDLIEKTPEEIEQIQKIRDKKRKLKEKRKKIQEENIKKKQNKELSSDKKNATKMKEKDKLIKKAADEAFEIIKENTVEDNDEEYYREEVGEEPDKELFENSATNHNNERFSKRKYPFLNKNKTNNKKMKYDWESKKDSNKNEKQFKGKKDKYAKKEFKTKGKKVFKKKSNFKGKKNK